MCIKYTIFSLYHYVVSMQTVCCGTNPYLSGRQVDENRFWSAEAELGPDARDCSRSGGEKRVRLIFYLFFVRERGHAAFPPPPRNLSLIAIARGLVREPEMDKTTIFLHFKAKLYFSRTFLRKQCSVSSYWQNAAPFVPTQIWLLSWKFNICF